MSEEDRIKGGFDPMSIKPRVGSSYPPPFATSSKGREKRALGDASGLSNFGVNHVTLPPGCWSAQRHWHTLQDEFIFVVEGELVLVTDAGEQVLTAGMTAGFPAGVADGHHLINKSNANAVYLEVGDRTPGDGADYPDIDMKAEPRGEGRTGYRMVRNDGTPFVGED